MRLLVTGGAGYIGSVVAALLRGRARGGRARRPVHRPRGRRARRAAARPGRPSGTGAGGARRRRPTRVLHFAAKSLVAESVASPARYWREQPRRHARPARGHAGHRDAADRLLLHRRGLRRAGAHADRRDRARPGRPTRTARPSSPWTRRCAEHARMHGLGAVSLRYFNVAGAIRAGRQLARRAARPGDPPHPEHPRHALADSGPDAHVPIFGDDYPTPDGTCIRDYIHVADLARAHLLALDAARPAQHRIYNLGSGAGFSNLEVLEACREVTGQRDPGAGQPPAARRPGGAGRLLRRHPCRTGLAAGGRPARDGRRRVGVRPRPAPVSDAAGAVPTERWFGDWFGGRPEQVWRAPGRVNLIGEHTDYNEGCVLPFALDLGVTVAAGRRGDGVLAIRSRQAPGARPTCRWPTWRPAPVTGWAAYPAGVAWALREAGPSAGGRRQPGRRLGPAAGRRPVVLGRAGVRRRRSRWTACTGWTCPGRNWPRLAQRAENDFVGVPSGIMDQSASLLCRAGHALLLDCRTGVTADVPLDPAAAGLALLVVDTGARHALGDGRYAQRRRECEQAAALLGVRIAAGRHQPGRPRPARRPGAAPPGPARGHRERAGASRRSPCSPAVTSPGWARCCTPRTPRSGTISRSPGPRPTWRWTPPWPRARWAPG